MPKRWKRELRRQAKEQRKASGASEDKVQLLEKVDVEEDSVRVAARSHLAEKEGADMEYGSDDASDGKEEDDLPIGGHIRQEPSQARDSGRTAAVRPVTEPSALPIPSGGFNSHGTTLDASRQSNELPLLAARTQTLRWKATEVTVSAGGKLSFPVEVKHRGSRLSWCFQTTTKDIDFSVQLHQPDGTSTYIVPFARFDSHKEPVFATGRVEREGTCIFTWDNAYSWFNPKTLTYSIELTYSTDEDDDESSRAAAQQLRAIAASAPGISAALAEAREALPAARRRALAAEEALQAARAEAAAAEAAEAAARGAVEAAEAADRHARARRQALLWEALPVPVRRLVMRFAGPEQNALCERVSRSWYAVSRGDRTWQALAADAGMKTASSGEAGDAGAGDGAPMDVTSGLDRDDDDAGIVSVRGASRSVVLEAQGTWRDAFLEAFVSAGRDE